jgi:hypothetical protein
MPKEMPNPAKAKRLESKRRPIAGLDEMEDLYATGQLIKTLPFWKGACSK